MIDLCMPLGDRLAYANSINIDTRTNVIVINLDRNSIANRAQKWYRSDRNVIEKLAKRPHTCTYYYFRFVINLLKFVPLKFRCQENRLWIFIYLDTDFDLYFQSCTQVDTTFSTLIAISFGVFVYFYSVFSNILFHFAGIIRVIFQFSSFLLLLWYQDPNDTWLVSRYIFFTTKLRM